MVGGSADGGGVSSASSESGRYAEVHWLKHTDDEDDAFWLAEMLRLGILPEGYIYPKQERPIRDLLRKRGHLMRLRTSLVVSLQNILSRNLGLKVKVNDVKGLQQNRVTPLLGGSEDLAMTGQVRKETIDFVTRQIDEIERRIEKKVRSEGGVSIPSDAAGGGQDPGVDDHVGNRTDQSI